MPNMDINAEIQAIADAFEGREVRTALIEALRAVQTEVNQLAPATFIMGTETITVSDVGAFFLEKKLTLPFTPTSRTRLVGSFKEVTRRVSSHDCACLKFYYNSSDNSITALVLNPEASTLGYDSFPEGTYYVDWLVVDTGA